jgi:regulator of cell morphogenesis and NO signaling
MESFELTADARVGQIAAHHPLATRVFARHGIDFCCGGGAALRTACESRGLETPAVLDEIRAEIAAPETTEEDRRRWDDAPPAHLVRHILDAYHTPLREELPRLETMAQKVFKAHGDKQPERLFALLETVEALRSELEDHMAREERELFPAVVAGSAVPPMDLLLDDHAATGEALARLRRLTDDYRVPEGACNTWRALWHGLEALEGELHQHIHLENNVLFPRVAAA